MSIARTLLGRRGLSLLLRPTVYAQFVAGEKESEISQSMKKMSLLGLRPMLAVPIEEDLGDSTRYERDGLPKMKIQSLLNLLYTLMRVEIFIASHD